MSQSYPLPGHRYAAGTGAGFATVFQEQGRTFMVLAPEREYVPLYEAVDDDWTEWTFRGKIYQRHGHNPECPSFFKMKNSQGQDEWVYLSSPMRNAEYVFGNFDLDNYKLHERVRGDLNHSVNFYAVYPMFEESGQAVAGQTATAEFEIFLKHFL